MRKSLTDKQIRYLREILPPLIEEKTGSESSNRVCYLCQKVGKMESGSLKVVLQCEDPRNMRRGFIMDDPDLEWVCDECVKKWDL